MIKLLFQKYYQDLLDKGDYSTALSVLKKNPEILDLDPDNLEGVRSGLNRIYAQFSSHISEDLLKDGLTDVLRQVTGQSKLEFALR